MLVLFSLILGSDLSHNQQRPACPSACIEYANRSKCSAGTDVYSLVINNQTLSKQNGLLEARTKELEERCTTQLHQKKKLKIQYQKQNETLVTLKGRVNQLKQISTSKIRQKEGLQTNYQHQEKNLIQYKAKINELKTFCAEHKRQKLKLKTQYITLQDALAPLQIQMATYEKQVLPTSLKPESPLSAAIDAQHLEFNLQMEQFKNQKSALLANAKQLKNTICIM
jgi:chromosome segregation ATPase